LQKVVMSTTSSASKGKKDGLTDDHLTEEVDGAETLITLHEGNVPLEEEDVHEEGKEEELKGSAVKKKGLISVL